MWSVEVKTFNYNNTATIVQHLGPHVKLFASCGLCSFFCILFFKPTQFYSFSAKGCWFTSIRVDANWLLSCALLQSDVYSICLLSSMQSACSSLSTFTLWFVVIGVSVNGIILLFCVPMFYWSCYIYGPWQLVLIFISITAVIVSLYHWKRGKWRFSCTYGNANYPYFHDLLPSPHSASLSAGPFMTELQWCHYTRSYCTCAMGTFLHW